MALKPHARTQATIQVVVSDSHPERQTPEERRRMQTYATGSKLKARLVEAGRRGGLARAGTQGLVRDFLRQLIAELQARQARLYDADVKREKALARLRPVTSRRRRPATPPCPRVRSKDVWTALVDGSRPEAKARTLAPQVLKACRGLKTYRVGEFNRMLQCQTTEGQWVPSGGLSFKSLQNEVARFHSQPGA